MQKYLQNSILTALLKQSNFKTEPSLIPQLADQITQELLCRATLDIDSNSQRIINQRLAEFKTYLIRGITRGGLNHFHVDTVESLDPIVSAAIELIQQEETIKLNAKIMYETITSHHESLRVRKEQNNSQAEVWEHTTSDTSYLKDYSEAASAMGEKGWVRDGMNWCAQQAIKFYYNSGWKLDERKITPTQKRWSDVRSVVPSSTIDLLLKRNENNQTSHFLNRPIKLLDVGSCYNPFAKMAIKIPETGVHESLSASDESVDAFEITAIDLCPLEGCQDVFQCDFLACPIVKGDDADPVMKLEQSKSLVKDKKKVKLDGVKVESLRSSSFDVVVMSLVLSYIPDPMMRAEMIARSYECLRKPSENEPNEAGLLLLFERGSIANYDDGILGEWVSSIESLGFLLVRYEYSRTKGVAHAHAFAFQTIPRKGSEERKPLRIKEDRLSP